MFPENIIVNITANFVRLTEPYCFSKSTYATEVLQKLYLKPRVIREFSGCYLSAMVKPRAKINLHTTSNMRQTLSRTRRKMPESRH
jgi:hypothetical protein